MTSKMNVQEEASDVNENVTEKNVLNNPSKNKNFAFNPPQQKTSLSNVLSKYSGCALAAITSFSSFISPILMILIPKFGGSNWKVEECKTDCQSLVISLSMRLLILLMGTWALFWRKPQSNMPRVFKGRATVVLILFILISVYWLFYVVRVIIMKESSYQTIVGFASNIVDCLIFIHYLTVILVELRHMRRQYIVKIVRSPDGASHQFLVGHISMQRLAVLCLCHHHTDFDNYNPYLDRMMAARLAKMARTCEFKIYNMNEEETPLSTQHEMIKSRISKDKQVGSHNYYLELMSLEEGYKRKVQKRKWKLMAAADQSFENIRNLQIQKIGGLQLSNSYEAAQTVFAGIANPLQKYLRATRQQPRHSVEGIVAHIEQCLLYNLSSKAFLQTYLDQGKALTESKQNWVLLSSVNVNSDICNGTEFCLQRGNVSLLVEVVSLPFFKLSEDDSLFTTSNNKRPRLPQPNETCL